MPTVHAYARVSSVEQAADDRSSLDDQVRRCRGVAMAAGLPDPTIYIDPGVSGSIPLAKRPEGGRMHAALQAGDTVIAAKLDRLFRSASDALVSVETMKAAGVKLILVDIGTEPVTESAVSKMFLGIMASVAEFEKTRILERMDDGRKGKKARGGHIGGLAPYGFRKIGSGKSAMLEPEPSEQAVIALVRQLRETGVPFLKICLRLEHMGHLSRTGATFRPIQVQRMLAGEG